MPFRSEWGAIASRKFLVQYSFALTLDEEGAMKAYAITTGVVFALLVVAHLWRVADEGRGVLNPFFVGVTLIASALAAWAWRISRKA